MRQLETLRACYFTWRVVCLKYKQKGLSGGGGLKKSHKCINAYSSILLLSLYQSPKMSCSFSPLTTKVLPNSGVWQMLIATEKPAFPWGRADCMAKHRALGFETITGPKQVSCFCLSLCIFQCLTFCNIKGMLYFKRDYLK